MHVSLYLFIYCTLNLMAFFFFPLCVCLCVFLSFWKLTEDNEIDWFLFEFVLSSSGCQKKQPGRSGDPEREWRATSPAINARLDRRGGQWRSSVGTHFCIGWPLLRPRPRVHGNLVYLLVTILAVLRHPTTAIISYNKLSVEPDPGPDPAVLGFIFDD